MVVAPGDRDGDVLVGREHGVESPLLSDGGQIDAGVEGAPCSVERVALAAAMAVDSLLNTAPAAVQRVAGEADDVERVPPPRRSRSL
ncbi:hypothetical protein GCM10009640_11270 [Agrococcus citreus]|uniref:Uncharacterized protein n=1 Tax=Agrococcus citreus TaxID=84643 RepID=A0ABN1YRS1_9MICO